LRQKGASIRRVGRRVVDVESEGAEGEDPGGKEEAGDGEGDEVEGESRARLERAVEGAAGEEELSVALCCS
jgi:hypothetical protein